MTAILAIIRANPLAFGLGAALLLSASAFGFQTWRITQLHEQIGALESDVKQCLRANKSNQSTIEALRDAQARNQTQREAAIRRQQEAAERVRELEQELDQRGDDDVQVIERTVGNCLDEPIPDAIRMRVTRRRDGDGASGSGEGAAGPGQP